MKKNITYLTALGLFVALCPLLRGGDAAVRQPFRNHGLPSGSGAEVLPQGAVLHVQFNNLYQSVLNLEGFAKTAVPAGAVPALAQPLLQMDHPLLTLLGLKFLNEPLSLEKISRDFGIDAAKPVSVTLYPGDPRQLCVALVPISNPETFGGFVQKVLHPKSCQEISLGGKPAVRLEVSVGKFSTELYVVCSAHEAYICGSRSLALALHNNPASQRLSQDGFLRKVLHRDDHHDLSLTFNPALLKPFFLQAQALHSLAIPQLHLQRERLLKRVPAEVKARLEMQIQAQLGVKSLEEFADFAECFLIATYESLCDLIGEKIMAFEGLSVAASIAPGFPQLTLYVYSHDFQPEQSTAPIPPEAVRQAVAWLGKDFNNISVTGRRPQAKPCRFALAWLQQLKALMADKGLKSAFVDGVEKLLANQPLTQPLASKAPWVLTTSAPLNAPPPISQFHSLEDYGQAVLKNLSLPFSKSVKIVPGKGTDFLASCFKEETRTLNEQRKMGVDFAQTLTGRTPWLDQVSRFRSETLDREIAKFTLENAYLTHGGIFGYDQHEFINRRVFLARSVNGYLIYHQGGRNVSWLSQLPQQPEPACSEAMTKLLDRVPKGVNYFHVHRVLQGLPQAVNWLAAVENLGHADLSAYLAKANETAKAAASPDEATQRLKALKTPALVYSLNRDAQTGDLYCLLPGNLVFPRGKVVPLLQNLIADYAAKADRVGGGLVYTRVRPEVFEVSVVQSTEGLTTLLATVGNAVLKNYLGPEQRQKLIQTVVAKKDKDPERLDEILVRNPRWLFLPGPRQHRPAKIAGPIPSRNAQTPANLLDLSPHYNAALTQSWHEGGIANNTLKSLRPGIQELSGTRFDVRGLVQLSGQSALSQLDVRFPKEVKAIQVGRRGQQIHFLHATSWPATEGTRIGCYLVHYKDGQTQEVPIVYGRDVRDWWTQNQEPASDKLQVAWTGKNSAQFPNAPPVRLFKTTWKNPQPESEIQCIDYRTAMSASAPFLVAITVE